MTKIVLQCLIFLLYFPVYCELFINVFLRNTALKVMELNK
jgi:hypothetical protein